MKLLKSKLQQIIKEEIEKIIEEKDMVPGGIPRANLPDGCWQKVGPPPQNWTRCKGEATSKTPLGGFPSSQDKKQWLALPPEARQPVHPAGGGFGEKTEDEKYLQQIHRVMVQLGYELINPYKLIYKLDPGLALGLRCDKEWDENECNANRQHVRKMVKKNRLYSRWGMNEFGPTGDHNFSTYTDALNWSADKEERIPAIWVGHQDNED